MIIFSTESPTESPGARLARLEHQLAELESQVLRTDRAAWPDECQRLLADASAGRHRGRAAPSRGSEMSPSESIRARIRELWAERRAIGRTADPVKYEMATRRFEDAKAERDWMMRQQPAALNVVEIARERGLRVETFASGAVRITGPGICVTAASVALVDVPEIDPNNRYPRRRYQS